MDINSVVTFEGFNGTVELKFSHLFKLDVFEVEERGKI